MSATCGCSAAQPSTRMGAKWPKLHTATAWKALLQAMEWIGAWPKAMWPTGVGVAVAKSQMVTVPSSDPHSTNWPSAVRQSVRSTHRCWAHTSAQLVTSVTGRVSVLLRAQVSPPRPPGVPSQGPRQMQRRLSPGLRANLMGALLQRMPLKRRATSSSLAFSATRSLTPLGLLQGEATAATAGWRL